MKAIIAVHYYIHWYNISKDTEDLKFCIGLIWASEDDWKSQ